MSSHAEIIDRLKRLADATNFGAPATEKQIAYIATLMEGRGLGVRFLDSYDILTKRGASNMITTVRAMADSACKAYA